MTPKHRAGRGPAPTQIPVEKPRSAYNVSFATMESGEMTVMLGQRNISTGLMTFWRLSDMEITNPRHWDLPSALDLISRMIECDAEFDRFTL